MKKQVLTTFLFLALIGAGAYFVSDYFLNRLDEKTLLNYKSLAILNKIQEMRYHLTTIHEEMLELRHYSLEVEVLQKKVEHSQLEMGNLYHLLEEVRDNEDVLKRYALRIEPLDKALAHYAEKLFPILHVNDPAEKKRLLDEAIAYGEGVGVMLEGLEGAMDRESAEMGAGIQTLPEDIKWYRTLFLLVEFSLILVFVLILITYTRGRVRNIIELIQKIQTEGVEPLLRSMSHDRELRHVATEMTSLMDKIQKNEQTLERMTVIDPLTGLHNRRYFQDRLQEEFKRFLRYNTLFSIAIVDVDHFKKINDTYGHQQGDSVLKEVAHLLKKKTRETDIVARYGGEEFVIVYTSTDKAGALVNIDRVRAEIADYSFPGLPQKLTISGGISDATGRTTAEEVIGDADSALYQAKNGGRNRCEVHASPHSLLGDPTLGKKGTIPALTTH